MIKKELDVVYSVFFSPRKPFILPLHVHIRGYTEYISLT